jgi:hypothetical protein
VAIQLEIVAPLVSGLKHCQQCTPFLDDAGVSEAINRRELGSVPDEVWQEYVRLSALVRDLSQRYGTGLQIRLVDPQTPGGFWKSLRHWVRTYPTFIIDGRRAVTGWDIGALDKALAAQRTPA